MVFRHGANYSTQVQYWDEQKCESIKRSNARTSLQGNMRTYTANAAVVREQAGKIWKCQIAVN